MNYSLFTEDEKKKINDQLGIFGFPTQSNNVGSSYSEDKQKLLDDYELKKEALDSIVQSGDEELDTYADNYNSLGSRAARALQSLGASYQGKDPTAVFNAQQLMKQNDIKNILDRNKNKRDLAYTQAKDVLSRIDNLDKLETDRKKNELEQQRWEKAFERQQNLDQINQSNADRNYNLELQKLNLTKDLQNQKAAQSEEQAKNKLILEDQDYSNLDKNADFAYDKRVFNNLNKNKRAKQNAVSTFGYAVAQSYGIDPKDQTKWVEDNMRSGRLPSINDPFEVMNQKVNIIMSQHPAYKRMKARQEDAQAKGSMVGQKMTLNGKEYIYNGDGSLTDTQTFETYEQDEKGNFKKVQDANFYGVK